MTAHDLATGTSWAVIDRPYNSDASRLFLSMSAHSKFLEVRRSVFPFILTFRRRPLFQLRTGLALGVSRPRAQETVLQRERFAVSGGVLGTLGTEGVSPLL